MNRESLHRQIQQMTLTPVPNFFSRSKVTSSIVITMNLGFNSTCRRKKHSPIPLKYVDVALSTHTDLDVLQEKRIDDCWNVGSNRHFVRFLERIHKMHSTEKPSRRRYVVPEDTDKDPNNYQTRSCMARSLDEHR